MGRKKVDDIKAVPAFDDNFRCEFIDGYYFIKITKWTIVIIPAAHIGKLLTTIADCVNATANKETK